MSFCSFSKESNNSGKTIIDNLFITNYIVDAPENAVKVYLYGLYLCQNSSEEDVNSCASSLQLTVEEVIDYFKFWSDYGILSIVTLDPFTVKYYPINESGLKYRKFKPEKYSDFTKTMQLVISERMISVSEFNEYFNLLESTAIKPEALIMIAKYCVDLKGANIGVKYIITVAKDFISRGITTPLLVEKELENYNSTTKEIFDLFNLMKITRKPESEDQNLYKKWVDDYGYDKNVLSFIITFKNVKNFKKLDGIIEELYASKCFSEESISYYLKNKDKLYELTIEISKQLGERIEVIEPYVKNYTAVWTSKGYDGETLLYIANRNFRKRKRTFIDMNDTINKLQQLGLITLSAITEYISKNNANEKFIATLLEKMGENRNPNEWDKENLQLWRSWNFTDEMIFEAAKRSQGKPVNYIHSVLSNWKQKEIFSIEAVERDAINYQNSVKTNNTYNQKYTTEQLINKVNAKYLEFKTKEDARLNALNLKLKKHPEYTNIENEVGKVKFEIAKAEYNENQSDAIKYNSQLNTLLNKKLDILKSLNITEESLKPMHVCRDCEDTGYVNGVRCSCFYKYLEEFTEENLKNN